MFAVEFFESYPSQKSAMDGAPSSPISSAAVRHGGRPGPPAVLPGTNPRPAARRVLAWNKLQRELWAAPPGDIFARQPRAKRKLTLNCAEAPRFSWSNNGFDACGAAGV